MKSRKVSIHHKNVKRAPFGMDQESRKAGPARLSHPTRLQPQSVLNLAQMVARVAKLQGEGYGAMVTAMGNQRYIRRISR